MGEYIVKVRSIRHVTHDVLQIVIDKPQHYDFNPGQATDVSINKDGWKDEFERIYVYLSSRG